MAAHSANRELYYQYIIDHFILSSPMTQELKISIFGIAAIFALEGYALYQGVDGTMFSMSVAGIGGVVGYLIKAYRKK